MVPGLRFRYAREHTGLQILHKYNKFRDEGNRTGPLAVPGICSQSNGIPVNR